MIGAFGGRPARDEADDIPIAVEANAAISVRLAIGHQRERDEGVRACVRGVERVQVDVGERVAVDDQERLGADDRQCLPRSACAAEHGRLFPRIPHARRQIAAVADRCGQRFWKVMEVEHEVRDAVGREPCDDAPRQRLARHRDRRLCAHLGQRTKTRAQSGGEQERVARRRHNPLTRNRTTSR